MSVTGFYLLKFLDDFAKYKIVQNKMHVFTVDHTLQELTVTIVDCFNFISISTCLNHMKIVLSHIKRASNLIISLYKNY